MASDETDVNFQFFRKQGCWGQRGAVGEGGDIDLPQPMEKINKTDYICRTQKSNVVMLYFVYAGIHVGHC